VGLFCIMGHEMFSCIVKCYDPDVTRFLKKARDTN
jgi:hypothetical protein